MSKLITYRLNEIANVIDCEHKTAPKIDSSEYYSIRTPDIKNGRLLYEQANRVSAETYTSWTKRGIPETGDLILAREAPVGEVGWIDKDHKICLGQRTVLIKIYSDKIDKKFLLYSFVSPRFKDYLNELSGGSVVAHLNMKDIRALEFSFPPLPEQKAIASVLSSLDDKIDLLHRQNKTLEAMAETLFRQWFIEDAKEDWEEVKVKDYVTLNKSTLNKNYPFTEILYLDTGSLTKGIVSELQPYNLKEAPSRAKRLVQNNDVLISTVRPNQCHYGIVSRPKDNLVVSTGFCTITCNQISPYFIYLLLTSDDMTEYLHSVAEGSTSTYPSLKPEDIGVVTFKLPPEDLMYEFHSIAESYWKKIHMNLEQIQTLEQLRDTLLPKLMSGEVRVLWG
ncbi:restriction endonuclease subunit S [Acinetobacter baumannii]|uniref:restriction endonuclease subunit S n=1 Tax=Acinetobacter baumannii TaxID=470 RepID=UPI00293FA03F|nr:restriction endonuclease subunit S [Acinetobacter baumannii]MDV4276317.1 restriction endonuclease subunit S [Acinetobacter baumannii]